MEIRPLLEGDTKAVKSILDSIELFPAKILDQMTGPYFYEEDSREIWFTAVENEIPVGIGLCVPELLTEDTYNIVSIGVGALEQGKGIGTKMMTYIESELKKINGRLLIVETSSDEKYIKTQAFYNKLGYNKEAIIKDFWQAGEDKIIYTKRLI